MQAIIDGMQNAFQMAGGSAGLSALFLAGLLVLWHVKFNNNVANDLFGFALITLIVIINPLYIWGVNKFFPELGKNNLLLWILPVVPVIVYVTAIVVTSLDNRFKKISFMVGTLGIMFLATTTSYELNEIRLVSNDEYIATSEINAINALSRYLDEYKKDSILIYGPDEIMRDVRQKDARIKTIYGKDLYEPDIDPQMKQYYDGWYTLVFQRIQEGAPKLEDIVVVADSRACDAIIIRTESFNNNEIDIPNIINMTYYLRYYDEYYCVFTREK